MTKSQDKAFNQLLSKASNTGLRSVTVQKADTVNSVLYFIINSNFINNPLPADNKSLIGFISSRGKVTITGEY